MCFFLPGHTFYLLDETSAIRQQEGEPNIITESVVRA